MGQYREYSTLEILWEHHQVEVLPNGKACFNWEHNAKEFYESLTKLQRCDLERKGLDLEKM